MTFYPSRFDPAQPWALPTSSRDLWFAADDGTRLHGWLLESTTRPSRGAVLYFHGNAGYVPTYLPAIERLRAHGFDVLIWDYRGYGRSDGRPEDETALYRDGDAAMRAFAEATGTPIDRLILYGHSLGTTVATEMALRHGCGALILQAPLASVSHQIAHSMPWMPLFFIRLAANRFDTLQKISALRCPVLIMHGEKDSVISVEQGRAVFDAAREPKRLKLYPEGQHVLGESTGWSHIDEVARFVAEMAN